MSIICSINDHGDDDAADKEYEDDEFILCMAATVSPKISNPSMFILLMGQT